jgi:hypothetical protein
MTTRKKTTTGREKAKKHNSKATMRDLDAKRAAGRVKGGSKHIGGIKYDDITITP